MADPNIKSRRSLRSSLKTPKRSDLCAKPGTSRSLSPRNEANNANPGTSRDLLSDESGFTPKRLMWTAPHDSPRGNPETIPLSEGGYIIDGKPVTGIEYMLRDSQSLKKSLGSLDLSDLIDNEEKMEREKDKKEMESLVIWRRPIGTLYHAILEVFILLATFLKVFRETTKIKFSNVVIVVLLMVNACTLVQGPHQKILALVMLKAQHWLYWFGLGVLSTIGMGTGVNTFVLRLAPHIAGLTRAAYECGSVEFPSPPYPDAVICPDEIDPVWAVSLWNILYMTCGDAFWFGLGTAFGELPPFFMGRALRFSSCVEVKTTKLRSVLRKRQRKLTYPELVMKFMANLWKKMGFIGILIFASIPNPFFDVAGLTCGYFSVPKWDFFAATLIGKSIIKITLQQVFIILAFGKDSITSVVETISYIPVFGKILQRSLRSFLEEQKDQLERAEVDYEKNILWNYTNVSAVLMLIYYGVITANFLAKKSCSRLQKQKARKREMLFQHSKIVSKRTPTYPKDN